MMESSFAVAAIVFAIVFGSALLGAGVRRLVPAGHLDSEARDVAKLAIGLIATMAALVLGLLTASAKSSFDTVDNEIKQSAAHIVLLDRVLAQYGPETQGLRRTIRDAVALRLDTTWPEDSQARVHVDAGEMAPSLEDAQGRIRALTPQTDTQRVLQARALAISDQLAEQRWLIFSEAGTAIPLPFLIVLVAWLSLLFAMFGLLAPRNPTIFSVLALGGLAVAGSILLILEMSQPLSGWIRVSSGPLRYALAHLGK